MEYTVEISPDDYQGFGLGDIGVDTRGFVECYDVKRIRTICWKI